MSQQFIYQMVRLSKVLRGGRELFKSISLSFFPGAKIGVLGKNGAGKSTLLRIMAGLDRQYDGDTWVDPNASVGYLPQEPQLDPTLDVRGNIELGLSAQRQLLDRFDEVCARFEEDLSADEMDAVIAEQGELQEQIDALDAWDLDRHVEIAMDAMRVPPGDTDVTTLSGGEVRRVALCQLLLRRPDLLLLDEPTNHLDTESVAWLERHLSEYAGTVILVTHDRYFLDNVVGWILELSGGSGIPWEGNYSSWLEQKMERLERQQKARTARQKALERELGWVRMSQKARQTKSRARLKNYERMLEDVREGSGSQASIAISIPPGPRLGDVVVRASGVSKAFGDRLLFEDLTFDLPKNGIVGITGPNGAGKTTLFRMIVGTEEPTSGELTVGETVQLAHVDQQRASLDDTKSVYDNISEGSETLKVGRREVNLRAYVAAFGFKGPGQSQLVGELSGGERNRVHLAKLLTTGGNLILLDEPTNDLDVETLRVLEEALEGFCGCAVVISHDRWFLDRIATHILAFEGNSEVVWFEGNYQAYRTARRERLGDDADQPHRIKYRKLVR